jgi:hypothetical protein
MIWEMALLGPRVANVRLLSLNKIDLKLQREIEANNGGDRNSEDEAMAPRASSDHAHSPETTESAEDGRLYLDGPHIGVKWNAAPVQILFACMESFIVASKYYKRVFLTHSTLPETYFNFSQDTLYIRYDAFSWYSTLKYQSPVV